MTAVSETSEHATLAQDARRSLGIASKLGMSLVATWAIALFVRIALPRFLGPSDFGNFQFADAFTTTIFVVATLGLDTYIRKEVATRPEHASEFFGGAMAISLALSTLVMVIALFSLAYVGRSADTLWLVGIMGLAQILFNLNALLVAMLHARGTVDELSLVNIGAKILWGAGIVGALLLHFGLIGAGVAVLAAEIFRTIVLTVLAQRHVALRLHMDFSQTFLALQSSLPFYVAGLAQTIYTRIDLSIMSFLAPEHEVGWYGAASTLGGLSLMLSPVIAWVLLPLTARAAARGNDELMLLARRSIELVLTLAFPIALCLYLAASELVLLAFGKDYAPSVQAVRILAPTFILTYVAMVYGSVLIRLDRGWAGTMVSLGGMIISPILNTILVPRLMVAYGQGGAGRAAAITLVVTEAYTVLAYIVLLGSKTGDRRLLRMLVLTLVATAATIAVDQYFKSLGIIRFVIDAAVYIAIAVATGAADVRGGFTLWQTLRARGTDAVVPAA